MELIKTILWRHARYQIFLNTSDISKDQYVVFRHLKGWRVFDSLEAAEKEIRKSPRIVSTRR